MAANKLDGLALSKRLRSELAAKIQSAVASGMPTPGLAVVVVGDNPASHTYVRNKRKACADIGIYSELHHLSVNTTQSELRDRIIKLNEQSTVHGILVQLPLPKQIDETEIIHSVSPFKDVDAFHPMNVGLLMSGIPRFYPCTPYGCIELLRQNNISTAGREVVIVGRSHIVGKPLAVMMMQKPSSQNPAGCDATVTVAHTKSKSLQELCRRADILIAAAGQPHLIKADMIKPGAAVIDVGTNVSSDGKLIGDVAPEVWEVAGSMSPVPGGVGPMTITMLLENTFQATKLISGYS